MRRKIDVRTPHAKPWLLSLTFVLALSLSGGHVIWAQTPQSEEITEVTEQPPPEPEQPPTEPEQPPAEPDQPPAEPEQPPVEPEQPADPEPVVDEDPPTDGVGDTDSEESAPDESDTSLPDTTEPEDSTIPEHGDDALVDEEDDTEADETDLSESPAEEEGETPPDSGDSASDDETLTDGEVGTPGPEINDENGADVATPESVEQDEEDEIVPAITWNQSQPIRCNLQAGSRSDLELNESSVYRCSAVAEAFSDSVMPEDMQIAWTVNLDFADSYQLQLPAGSTASILNVQPGASATATSYLLQVPWNYASNAQVVEFDVVITRTTCVVGEQVMRVQADAVVSAITSEAEILRVGEAGPARQLASNYLPNLEPPTASMSSVSFEPLVWDGTSWGTTRSTSTVTLTNPSQCGTENTYMVRLAVTASHPEAVPQVVAVHGEQIESPTSFQEDIIAVVPAGFVGSDAVVVELELSPHSSLPMGQYQINFQVTVVGVSP